MLKVATLNRSLRSLSSTAINSRVYDFSGDQIWWSIRKPGLDTSKQSGGRRTVLRPRIDFWEKTKYGHGGKAKIYAGLKHDHQTFEKGEVSEDTPTDRKYAVEAFEVNLYVRHNTYYFSND